MRYRKLGRTGLDVSPVCLGCMSFGDPERGNHPWSLDEEASRPLIHRALDRRRLAAWDAEWDVAGPHWTDHR